MAAKVKVDKNLAKKIAEKKTPAGKLRDLSDAEILTKINELKQELFNLRFQAEVGKLENTAQLKKVKKEIKLCDVIYNNVPDMKQQIKEVEDKEQEKEQKQKKKIRRYEL